MSALDHQMFAAKKQVCGSVCVCVCVCVCVGVWSCVHGSYRWALPSIHLDHCVAVWKELLCLNLLHK